ncbi:energy transducer TonB [Meridianimaribacter sp. CL38]|jgi:hypothetical protein|uniref:energy transducer TonB n=1 Tax=Meridianimaribacter sp. CL38 TaxID=2213021 RepID=UPI001375D041|nr:energy transducer TonB [Meridianimaribacter sp. CL38]
MKKIVFFICLLLVKQATAQDKINWHQFGESENLFSAIYYGHFGDIENDIYFKTLFLSYINFMSSSCPEALPSNKIEYQVDVAVFSQVYSHTFYTGENTMPFIDMYQNKKSTQKQTIYVDPKFQKVAQGYIDKGFSGQVVKKLLSDYEKFGDFSVHQIVLFKSFSCNSKERNQFGENLYRFATGQKPLKIKLEPEEPKKTKKVEKVENIGYSYPIAIVRQPPVFPGCEDVRVSERRNCFNQKITKYVMQNPDYINELNKGKINQAIYVSFVITKEGDIKKITARAKNDELKQLAIRIIQSLPKIEPGMHDNEKVNVQFTLPILF